MKRQWQVAFAASALLIITGFMLHSDSLAQDELKIKPGKYEIMTKMRSSLDNALSKKTIERCIEGNTINPQSFLPDPERCTLSNLKKTGNKSSFDMKCTSPNGMNLTGHMEYTVAETSFSYKFKLKAPHNDGTFEVESEGDAKRIGDC